ncbi:MAG: hypothetical protein DMG88_04400 [Acidobacteria bacterium]|nr:MAG: hypothetical protein DMG88_04400 [Acidobacteriota bacterium]
MDHSPCIDDGTIRTLAGVLTARSWVLLGALRLIADAPMRLQTLIGESSLTAEFAKEGTRSPQGKNLLLCKDFHPARNSSSTGFCFGFILEVEVNWSLCKRIQSLVDRRAA